MQRLMYISSAHLSLNKQDLNSILQESVSFNSKYWITGVLLYNGLNFMQLLEGTTGVVENLYARIVKDARHTSVATVLKEPADNRIFPDWSMQLKRRISVAFPGAAHVDDFSAVHSQAMPEHIRSIFRNFDQLRS